MVAGWKELDQGRREASRKKPGKSKEANSPPEPPEKTEICQRFDFSPVETIFHLDLQNCKVTHLCCFMSLILWGFTRAEEETNMVAMDGFIEKLILGQRSKGCGESCKYLRKKHSRQRNRKCQILEAEAHLVCWKRLDCSRQGQKPGGQLGAILIIQMRDDDGMDRGSAEWWVSRCVLQRSFCL